MTATAQFKLKNKIILSEKVEEMHEGVLFHWLTTANNQLVSKKKDTLKWVLIRKIEE